MREIKRGAVCWNCRHGMFSKRKGDLVGRGRGQCLYDAGIPPFPREWNPPAAFWQALADDDFPESFEDFRSSTALLYYGHAAALDALTGTNLHKGTDLRTEFTYMRWLADNKEKIVGISWQDACDEHDLWR